VPLVCLLAHDYFLVFVCKKKIKFIRRFAYPVLPFAMMFCRVLLPQETTAAPSWQPFKNDKTKAM
jgi:hypothetical protein